MNVKSCSLLFLLSTGILIWLHVAFNIHLLWVFIPLVLYIHCLVFGSIFIGLNFYLKSIHDLKGQQGIKTTDICLTFDDGIHPIYTEQILDVLKQYQVPAMFFLIGKNLVGNESLLRRIYQEGHTIGNHSELHSAWFDLQPSSKMKAEITQMNERVKSILGFTPIFFRPPYGVTNPNLAKAIRETHMISVGWNLRSFDTIAKSKQDLLATLKQKTKANQLVLLHDRCEFTAEALTDYIIFCKEQGFTFATLTV